jgi:hypothetical protein
MFRGVQNDSTWLCGKIGTGNDISPGMGTREDIGAIDIE